MEGNQSDLEDIIIAAAVASVVLRPKTKKKRRFQVNPYLAKRSSKGRFNRDFSDMEKYPESFRENFHMSSDTFNSIHELIKGRLEPKPKARPDSLSSKEQLSITLEFLASGSLQRHVASVYRTSKQVLGVVIEKTCEAIYDALLPITINEFTPDNWIKAANQYNHKWNFPNCCGSIDGKHVAIRCPKNGGSGYYNYKRFHSLVLMAVADADYKFLYFNIGAPGSEGDASVFRSCEFGQMMLDETLNLPCDTVLLGKRTPFFYVADDAFPLTKRIMKPYTPKRSDPLSESDLIFNYRLSRARRCVENCFGILSARWMCLSRTLFMKPERVKKVVSACCILHNYLMKQSSSVYCPTGFADSYSDSGNLVEGSWRNNLPSNSIMSVASSLETQSNGFNRPSELAKCMRDRIREYVNSSVGCVSWQNERVLGKYS